MKKSELQQIIREEIKLLTEDVIDEKMFDKFVVALTKKKVGATVKFIESKREQIYVELGFDYPNRLFDKVWDVANSLGIANQISICADSAGGNIKKKVRINSGPKRW